MAPFGSGHTVLDGNSTPDSPRIAASADTVAAFDFAHEATEAAAQLTAAAYSDGDEPSQGVEASEPEPAPLEVSEAWLEATEALQDALEAAQDAEDARDATSAAASAAQAAAGNAKNAARAIYRAAQADGDWESMVTDTRAHVAAARSADEAAAGFATDTVDAQTATEAAADAARIAVQTREAARALAEQGGATEGADAYTEAYRDMRSDRGAMHAWPPGDTQCTSVRPSVDWRGYRDGASGPVSPRPSAPNHGCYTAPSHCRPARPTSEAHLQRSIDILTAQ